MKKKIIIGTAVLVTVLLISGVTIFAAAAPGDNSDPLITLSYLNGPFRTLIGTDIQTALSNLTARLTNAENTLKTDIEKARTDTGYIFKLVTVKAGTPQSFAPGSELMLESGAAAFSVYKGDMVCSTGTPSVAETGNMAVYNMYLSTGTVTVTATGGDAKIWVRNAAG